MKGENAMMPQYDPYRPGEWETCERLPEMFRHEPLDHGYMCSGNPETKNKCWNCPYYICEGEF